VHVHFQRLVSVVKMATMLEDYATEELHSALSVSWARGPKAKDIV
jgi:hypothetical protein